MSIEQFIDNLLPRATKAQLTILAQTNEEQAILDLLAGGVSEGDELQAKSKLGSTDYSQAMTMLEIRGAIRSLGANRWGL